MKITKSDQARVRAWTFADALPVWAEAGLDRAGGGFVEALTLDGAPLAAIDRRLRVQARQVYVYSHAAVLGWDGPALEAARGGFEYMTRHCWHRDSGWVFSVAADGAPRDNRRWAYEQAFALLAFAWYYRASGEAAALDWASRTLAFLDASLADPDRGGYREAVPEAKPRRQNPHMPSPGSDASAARRHRRWRLPGARPVRWWGCSRGHFFDAPSATLGEFFTDDWHPAPGVEGQLVEPGHHYEWVWLLHQYAKATGEDLRAEVEALYGFAEAHGVDPADGMAYDAVLRDGTVAQPSKRCWPQSEALKAQLAMGEWLGLDTGARVAAITNGLFRRYLGLGRGIWQDQLDSTGAGAAERVPASNLYHLFLAFTELMRASEAGR